MTSCKDAIKNWETKTGEVAAEATAVKLYAQNPPISKMDAALNSLDKCEHLSLSTNSIDRLIPLTGKVLVLSWTHRMAGRSVQHPILFKSSLLTVCTRTGSMVGPTECWIVFIVGLTDSNINFLIVSCSFLLLVPGLKNLRILSISRNAIKKIEKLDDVAGTLTEIWASYNFVSNLDGLHNLTNLEVLYVSGGVSSLWCVQSRSGVRCAGQTNIVHSVAFGHFWFCSHFFFSFFLNVVAVTCTFVQTGLQLSNNKIKDVGELGKLAGLPNLRDILLIGNPCYEGMEKAEQRAAVLAQLPNIAKIDGEMVTAADREGGGETKE